MPIALALVAGGLATINPCGFPLLPAFLGFYVGADERDLPRASTRAAQGLLVGLIVAGGFLSVFALIGIPISYGATQITEAVPWAGFVVGLLMALVGVVILAGKELSFSFAKSTLATRERRVSRMFAFGAAYAVASLGCTMPIFVALIGASIATDNPAQGLIVFGAYGLGMATTLMALSVGAALLRNGLARLLKKMLPYMNRIAGALLLLAGAYVAYYWGNVLWAPVERLGDDPLVSFVERFAAGVQRTAGSGGGRALLMIAGLIVAVAISIAIWRAGGPKTSTSSKESVS